MSRPTWLKSQVANEPQLLKAFFSMSLTELGSSAEERSESPMKERVGTRSTPSPMRTDSSRSQELKT